MYSSLTSPKTDNCSIGSSSDEANDKTIGFSTGSCSTLVFCSSSDEPDDIIDTGLDLLIGDDVDFGRTSSTFFESDSSNSSSTGVGGDGEKPHDVKL